MDPHAPMITAAAAPSVDSKSPSMISSQQSRAVVTPSALRIAISRRRRMPRTSIRLATFPTAISSKISDTPASRSEMETSCLRSAGPSAATIGPVTTVDVVSRMPALCRAARYATVALTVTR